MRKCLIVLPFILIFCLAALCGCAKNRTGATVTERVSAPDDSVQITADAPEQDCNDGDCEENGDSDEKDDCKDGKCKRLLPRMGHKKEKALLDGETDDDEYEFELPFRVRLDIIISPKPPRNKIPVEPHGEQ